MGLLKDEEYGIMPTANENVKLLAYKAIIHPSLTF